MAERERALMSPMGQEAPREGWGHGLYHYIMSWGSTPTRPETKAALQREVNDLKWELMEMRKIEKPDQLTKALLHFLESVDARETELRDLYLKSAR